MEINESTIRALRVIQNSDLVVKLLKQYYATRKQK
jgi:hypothetical protein